MKLDTDLQAIQEVRDLLRRADQAQKLFAAFSQEETDKVVAAISDAAFSHARELAELAVQETGFGRVDDKTVKNTFAARAVYESIREMKTVGVVRADDRARIYEIAVPMGIVAGIVPSTNPTSTVIFKTLISLKARNGIVFSPHPSARGCIARAVDLLHEASVRAGAPEGLIGCLRAPTMESTQELMSHPLTAVILATGGAALVKAAYSSGKPAFGVGPGNVPAFIERTADVPRAVHNILAGTCFDNGTICASEQAMVVDRPVDARAREELRRANAHFCTPEEKKKLEAAVVVRGGLNPAIVGRAAHVIAGLAGFAIPESTTALVAELTGVGKDHPLSIEKLSPILAYYVADGWKEGCERCLELLRFGGMGHSMSIHSSDEDIILKFALEKPASRILANTPSTHGAIGYSTGLTPSLTLGCGSWGNNITSDNVTARHLLHIKRLAYGTKPVDFDRGDAPVSWAAPVGNPAPLPAGPMPSAAPSAHSSPKVVSSPGAAPDAGLNRDAVRSLVESALRDIMSGRKAEG